MINASLGALVGKRYMEIKMELITNNLANANTAGYKNSRVFINQKAEMIPEPPDKILPGLDDMDSYIDFSRGPFIETKNPLDLAIDGEGFFVVMTPQGVAYTRAGQFTLNAEKKLVTLDGMPVAGAGGEIRLEGSDIRIESDGSIFVDGNFVDKVKIVDFEDKKSLRQAGKCLFVNGDPRNMERIPEHVEVRQGYLEGSNVDIIRELLDMIATMRAYEAYTKVEQTQSEAKSKLLEVVRF